VSLDKLDPPWLRNVAFNIKLHKWQPILAEALIVRALEWGSALIADLVRISRSGRRLKIVLQARQSLSKVGAVSITVPEVWPWDKGAKQGSKGNKTVVNQSDR
jgi:hypothetical protein